jgi:hypothetical protein
VITSPQAYRRELARRGPQLPAWFNDPERQSARAARAARPPLPDPTVDLVDWSARPEKVVAPNPLLLPDDGSYDVPLSNRGDLQLARAAKAAKRAPTRPSASTNPLLVRD